MIVRLTQPRSLAETKCADFVVKVLKLVIVGRKVEVAKLGTEIRFNEIKSKS